MAINFSALNQYDFVSFGTTTMQEVDIGGKCAMQGSVSISQLNVGMQLPIAKSAFYFVLGDKGEIDGGTNTGCTAISREFNINNFSMENLNGEYPLVASPLYFPRAYDYIADAGPNWSFERANMTVAVVDNILTLEGENTSYNSAAFVANNLAGKGIKLEEIKEINIIAPITSSILINTLDVGTIIFPQEVIIKRNDTIITAENASSFAPYIVWNFSRNSEFEVKNTTIYGTVLNVAETRGEAGMCYLKNFNVYGQLIINAGEIYSGTVHYMPFAGELPDSTEVPVVGEFDVSKSGVVSYLDNIPSIRYTVTVTNIGTTKLTDVLIIDTPSKPFIIDESSIEINDESVIGNLIEGMELGSMQPFETIFIRFNAVGSDQQITNTIETTGYYIILQETKEIKGNAISNIDLINTSLIKTCNKSEAKIGEALSYTINFTNYSNFTIDSVTIIDTLAENVILEEESIKMNLPSSRGTLQEGLIFEDIATNTTITITFQVIIANDTTDKVVNVVKAISVFLDEYERKHTVIVNAQPIITNIDTKILSIIKTANPTFVTEKENEI